jgi:carbonic anhydrase
MPTEKILAGARRSKQVYEQNRALYETLVTQGQSPKVILIGCSDSRVVPELILSAQPGDLFVLRNVANIVPPFGLGEAGPGAMVEYGVLHLGVEHVVILGHTDCGGIKALEHSPDVIREYHIARWVENARPAQTKVQASSVPAEERHLATVRENVLLQLEHLRSYDAVRDAERQGKLGLHGWVYHLENGALERFEPGTKTWQEL